MVENIKPKQSRKGHTNNPNGRPLGIPNKATADARKAIAAFVDNNAHRLTGWLDRVAEENPSKAFELFQSVVEYHIPKLARTESFVEQTTEISGHIEIRPKLTKEEWMQAHGLGSTARTTS